MYVKVIYNLFMSFNNTAKSDLFVSERFHWERYG